MLISYRFSINGHSVSPRYSGDLAKEYELETGQRFFREKLSEELIFIGDDYDWLHYQTFDTEFVLQIEKSNNSGGTWSNYWSGFFYKTDGDWDADNKKVKINLETLDEYTNVLSGIDKKYDLIKLAPAKLELEIHKRSIIQIYIPGESKISCFLGGDSWEQDVAFEETDTSELTGTYHFALATTLRKVLVTGNGVPAGCMGEYVSESSTIWYGKNRDYYLEWVTYGTGWAYRLRRSYDDEEMFRSNVYLSATPPSLDLSLNPISSEASGEASAYYSTIEVYARYVTDSELVGSSRTELLPSEDIVVNNRNLRRAIGYAIDSISITSDTSDEPTKYGLAEDGTYFEEPYGFPSYPKYYPIAKTYWGLSSIWFNFDTFDWLLEEDARKPYLSSDVSMVSDVISVLLNEIDSSITHEGTSAYSEFLYAATNPVNAASFKVMLTQKSNITAGEYDQPAQKAMTSLGTILGMLRDVFKCYWFIEDGKLRIEHISWFMNGGSYTPSSSYTADLTTLQNPKNGKTWGFNSSKYQYDKEDLPERFEFNWMDDVPLGFTGFPIEVNSRFALLGKIEDVSVAECTTDVDYMLANPEAISPDGFVLMAAIFEDVNLFDSSDPDVEYSRGVSPTTGNLFSSFGYNATGYIPVTPNMKYTRSYFRNTAFYDQNKNYVSGESTETSSETITIPDGVFYVRCDVASTVWSSYEFKKGSSLDGLYTLPFIQRTVDSADLRLQNGYMSWVYLHPEYWRYNMPSNSLTINETPYTAGSINRTKKQEVSYPSEDDPEPMELVKTYLGDGEIEKISVNLSSRMNKIQLRYDTE